MQYYYVIPVTNPNTSTLFIVQSSIGDRGSSVVKARKVAGSIPDGAIGIFHWHNPSDSTMALGSTQPLTEMSTRSIFWGVKTAGA